MTNRPCLDSNLHHSSVMNLTDTQTQKITSAAGPLRYFYLSTMLSSEPEPGYRSMMPHAPSQGVVFPQHCYV